MPTNERDLVDRLLKACNGHPHALIPWPHRILHDAVAHIQAQAVRIAQLTEAWQKAADEADAIAESYDMLKGAWATDLAKLKKAEAELALVRDWARGRCVCCGSIKACNDNDPIYRMVAGPCANWTPAWEVK